MTAGSAIWSIITENFLLVLNCTPKTSKLREILISTILAVTVFTMKINDGERK